MLVRTPYQTFEFDQARELRFGSLEDAQNWLQHIGCSEADVIRQLRDLLSQYAADDADGRLSDRQVVDRIAMLLYTRRIAVTIREHRTASAKPAQAAPAPAPAFPLSERTSRPAAASGPPPTQNDAPTFGPDNAASAQAAALVAAAASGAPFCEECARQTS